jgi:hypothetical protein
VHSSSSSERLQVFSSAVLSRYEDTSSCRKRPSPLFPFLQPNEPKRNRTAPLRALGVYLSPTFVWTQFRRFSSAALSTCIARCCGRPFSATYLPATPSACPLGANSIRRPGFPPQSNHPIKTLLPQITSLHFRDMAPDDPFQVPLDCRPFIQDAAFPTTKLFVTHNFFADKRL